MRRLVLISLMLALLPVQGGCQRTEQPAPAARSGGQVLRFKKVSIQDRPDMIGGEAFSFLAPPDWQMEGGLFWRAHPAMPAAVALRLFNPRGPEQMEMFPTLGYSYGGMLGPGTYFPIGANYMGNEVQPPVRNALDYLKQRHLPRVRGNVQARFVKEEELPKLAEAARQAEGAPPGSPMVFTAGKVRIEFEVNGKAVEEDHYCVLNTMPLPAANMVLQIADKLTAFRAEKGKLDEQTKILQTMINSHRLNLQWYNRYMQVCQQLRQQQMQQIHAAGELSRYISQTHNEISDMIRQSYENRQASEDRINKTWSQYMRGVDEYYSPVEQRPVELPSGYGNAWVNGNGEYIVTDSANFNPNVEVGGNWQPLKKSGE